MLDTLFALAGTLVTVIEMVKHPAEVALAEMGFKTVFKKIGKSINSIHSNKHLAENGDLLKAVRIAMLDATLLLKDAVIKEMKMDSADKPLTAGNSITIFEKHFSDWITKEKKRASGKAEKDLINTEAYTQIEQLLNEPKNDSSETIRLALRKKCKEEFLKELKGELKENFPMLTEHFLLNGWDNGKKDWFDITCFLFGQILKEDEFELARFAFQDRLLSEIATGVKIISINIDEALNLLTQSIIYGQEINDKLDEIKKQLNRIESNSAISLLNDERMFNKQDEMFKLMIRLEQKIALQSSENEITNASNVQLQLLIKERDELKEQLAKRDDIIARQELNKKELEILLDAETEKDKLKEQALEAIVQKDYNKADELLQEAAKERIEKVAEDFYQLGIIKELKLEYSEALKYYELAAKIPPHNTLYLCHAASLAIDIGHIDDAIEYSNQAIELLHKETTRNTDGLIWAYRNIGFAFEEKGNYAKAIEYHEKALNVSLVSYGENTSITATCYNNLGVALNLIGNFDKGIETTEKAIEIDIKLFGVNHPSLITYYTNLGTLLRSKRNYKAGWRYYQTAVVICENLFWDKDIRLARCFYCMGIACSNIGDTGGASKYIQKALDISIKLLGEENPIAANCYHEIGMIRNELDLDLFAFTGIPWNFNGNPDVVTQNLEKAILICKKIYEEDNPKIASIYKDLGSVWQARSVTDKAIEYYKKSFSIFLKFYGVDNTFTKEIKKHLDDCMAGK